VILRDPVHGLIAFEGITEEVISSLLATREVQRLRRVRQLGMTALVFPGAEHSRFAHALGAGHLMVRLLAHVESRQEELPLEQRLDDEARRDAIAASFLHDLGHGPFSHLFEEVLPRARPHEEWTSDTLVSPDTEVHSALEALSSGMSERVVALLNGRHRLRYLGRAISGTLDVDRCDYLLRDSHMTGVRYGLYDLDWLLRALAFAEAPTADGGREWVLAIEGRKGLPPIESFFLARNNMYQQVYHHKATRAAEGLIRAVFIRVAEIIQDGGSLVSVPPALRAAVLGDTPSVNDYLSLDDSRLMACIEDWEQCDDAILSEFARRLLCRHLPKTIPLPAERPAIWEEAHARAADIVRRKGARPDLEVWLDVPSDIPYPEPDEPSAEGLWVTISHRPLQRVGDVSFLLGELRNKKLERPRLIIPAAHRSEIEAALEGILTQNEDPAWPTS